MNGLPALGAVLSVLLAGAAGALLASTLNWVLPLGLAAISTSLLIGSLHARSVGARQYDTAGHAEGGWAALHAELARSRRHNRRFTLVSIPGDVWLPPRASDATKEYLGVATASALQPLLRTADRSWADKGVVYVLLSECDREQAERFLERGRARMPGLFPAGQVLLASFPENAVTAGGLLHALRPEAAEPELRLPA